MLSIIMPNVVMLNVIMLNSVILITIMLNVSALVAIRLNAVKLSAIMLNVAEPGSAIRSQKLINTVLIIDKLVIYSFLIKAAFEKKEHSLDSTIMRFDSSGIKLGRLC